AGLRLEAPAGEVIRARRNHNAGRDLKGRGQEFKVRIPVEFEAIARLHPDVYGRHEIAPRLNISLQVGDAAVLAFKELLSNPAKRPFFLGTRLPVAASPELSRSRTREEAQLRIERIAIVVERLVAVPEVIGIINFVSPALSLAGTDVALCPRCPSTNKKIF